jgi:hypothetical protein
MTRPARIGPSGGLIAGRSYVSNGRIRRAQKTRTFTATMATRATTPGLAMRHTTVERLTMFWAIPSHTTATRAGAADDS